MKVYVDELPQTCLDCENVLCEHQIIEACYATRHPDCPLLSLSDYTKQVRKEVLDQVYKVFTTEDVWSELNSWWLVNGNCEELKNCLDAMVEETSVENIVKRFGHNKMFYQMLDQVQGETK